MAKPAAGEVPEAMGAGGQAGVFCAPGLNRRFNRSVVVQICSHG
jgi:hypothetical protein